MHFDFSKYHLNNHSHIFINTYVSPKLNYNELVEIFFKFKLIFNFN